MDVDEVLISLVIATVVLNVNINIVAFEGSGNKKAVYKFVDPSGGSCEIDILYSFRKYAMLYNDSVNFKLFEDSTFTLKELYFSNNGEDNCEICNCLTQIVKIEGVDYCSVCLAAYLNNNLAEGVRHFNTEHAVNLECVFLTRLFRRNQT